ncbi:MAG: NAD(P)-dependent dehydrogenase (short-subunit alcohol dehydrogenase family) [Myxococcota bacterium]|jgi:NAD(P)-dependent dehydrogenase (short-subunit alcohol dehydrogenase family)
MMTVIEGRWKADSMNLRSVLVTGGGSGIGAALAQVLASRGCEVLISGRRRDKLDSVASTSNRITICVGDVNDPAHRQELAAKLSILPEPRAVFHGAGYFQAGRLNDLSQADWRRSFETNVEARWALSRDCADLLLGGRLLFIGSDAGANPRPGAAAYSIAQAASETLRRALQAEWADRDTAVGGFKPGLVDTDMVRGFMAMPEKDFPSRSVYEQYMSNGQIVGPEVIACFAAWLLLDVSASRFSETEWDIRDVDHQPEWHEGALYPESATSNPGDPDEH